MNYYFQALKKYAVFSGRARRKEYWMFTLFNCIFVLITLVVDRFIGFNRGLSSIGIISTLYSFTVLIPGLSLCVRRLHDIGKRGSYLFLSLIPLIGTYVLLAYMCKEGEVGPNAYGEDPKSDCERSARPDVTMLSDESPLAAKRRTAHSMVMIGVELVAFLMFFFIVSIIDVRFETGMIGFFFYPRNLMNLMMVFLPIAFTSVGASIVFSRGSYDFSIGGVMALSGVVAATLLTSESPLAIPAAIGTALFIGLINAVGAGFAKKAAFLVTIATAAFARYLGMGISGYVPIPINGDGVNAAAGAFFWIVLVLASGGAVCMIQFPGKAARESAPRNGFVRLCSSAFPYLISSLLACAAGLITMYRMNCSTSGIGVNYDIYTVFAIALSGSFLGARNTNILGVLVGSLLVAVMSNVFSLLNVPLPVQMICITALIVVWFLINGLITQILFPEQREETCLSRRE